MAEQGLNPALQVLQPWVLYLAAAGVQLRLHRQTGQHEPGHIPRLVSSNAPLDLGAKPQTPKQRLHLAVMPGFALVSSSVQQ